MVDQIKKPHLITKPIQLLAAWLVGLSVVDTSFLAAAKLLGTEHWECGALVLASIVNVPIFIGALFLLQTRFRPEMQEDAFYFEYINKKTGVQTHVSKNELLEKQIEELRSVVNAVNIKFSRDVDVSDPPQRRRPASVAVNDHLPFYKEIRKSLKDAGIGVSSVFGKVNRTGNAPAIWIVVVADDVAPDRMLPVLKICCDFPFDGFVMAPREMDAGDEEDVYLGAYGPLKNIVSFTAEVVSEIKAAEKGSDLNFLRALH
jgi:hypothetical protein